MRARHVWCISSLVLLGACRAAVPAAEGSAAAAATSTPSDSAGAHAAIDAVNANLVAAMTKGDGAGMASHYTDDAVFMNPGAPSIVGRAAIGEMLAGMMGSATLTNVSIRTERLLVSGDLAIENGRYAWTVTPKGAPAMPDSGKYLTVWQKQADGSWKVIRDINNTDIAPKM